MSMMLLIPALDVNSSLLKLAGQILESDEVAALGDYKIPTGISATHLTPSGWYYLSANSRHSAISFNG